MSRLLVLFAAGFIGLSLRYFMLGKFEMGQLLTLLLFPAGGVLILFVMKWQYRKDLNFEPESIEMHWITRIGDRVSGTPKQIYRGSRRIGSFHRTYNSRWKRIIADIMDNPGLWYLNLSFTFGEGGDYTLHNLKEDKLTGNNEWRISKNGEEIGKFRTDLSLKNASTLKESLYLDLGPDTYRYTSFGIGSHTEVTMNQTTVGAGERLHGPVYAFSADQATDEEAAVLFIGSVLFNYQFEQ